MVRDVSQLALLHNPIFQIRNAPVDTGRRIGPDIKWTTHLTWFKVQEAVTA